ncbi:MAG: hypothetical protein KGK08_04825 [Acidobacteriota bacterium]|nr:hypothetical protein [Acidobacteriota bacterium]
MMQRLAQRTGIATLSLLLLALAGCGAVPATHLSTAATAGLDLQGRVHGGSQSVSGAHIYLFAAGSTGYGGASVSLLNPTFPGVATDSLGSYVTTDASGNFSITSAYHCTPGDEIYLLAAGGNPGLAPGVTNPALRLMSALGPCPTAGTLAGVLPLINISEVTTVGAVYALASFMTDATHLSSGGSALAYTGLQNAFNNVQMLVDPVSGAAQSFTFNAVPPAKTINTLANLIASCVNSTGNSPTCNTLFTNAKAPDGTVPTDTVTALINIAHNPGANVAALFALANANPPYQPSLPAAPNDWTIAVTFYSDSMAGPYYPAIDNAGNLWVPSFPANALYEYNPLGVPISGAAGFLGNLNQPYAVAIDGTQAAWVVNYSYGATSASASHFSASGATLGTTSCAPNCVAVAIDGNQNIWTAGSTGVTAVYNSGSPLGQFSVTAGASGLAIDSKGNGWMVGLNHALYKLTLPNSVTAYSQSISAVSGDLNNLAIDANDNVWFTSGKGNSIGRVDSTGKLVSPSTGYTGGGLNFPAQIAVDGANRIWVANRDGKSISAFNNDGTAFSPATGFIPSGQDPLDPTVAGYTGLQSPHGLAIDGSGNIWVTNFTANSITVFYGLAAPVVTPLSPHSYGQRP